MSTPYGTYADQMLRVNDLDSNKMLVVAECDEIEDAELILIANGYPFKGWINANETYGRDVYVARFNT